MRCTENSRTIERVFQPICVMPSRVQGQGHRTDVGMTEIPRPGNTGGIQTRCGATLPAIPQGYAAQLRPLDIGYRIQNGLPVFVLSAPPPSPPSADDFHLATQDRKDRPKLAQIPKPGTEPSPRAGFVGWLHFTLGLETFGDLAEERAADELSGRLRAVLGFGITGACEKCRFILQPLIK